MSRRKTMSKFVDPTNDEIAERAYKYYLRRLENNIVGSEQEDWKQAEVDLRKEKCPAIKPFIVKARSKKTKLL